MQRFEITRAAELESLAAFRALVDEASGQTGLPNRTRIDLKLAIDEACTNIIEHGYAGMNAGSIIVALRFEPARVVVQITDFGHPFEPSPPPTPDTQAIMDDQTAGGFGLHIIYQTMHEVHYSSTDTHNHLIFIKNLA